MHVIPQYSVIEVNSTTTYSLKTTIKLNQHLPHTLNTGTFMG